ncbi:hypothetical protein MSAN_00540600 [Mycena sanguinolenta]|uniref:Uncharacterized protein n=1 Tax=Mycena sanguinolenta TaxID=230812 RepID=A0A8H6ZBL4_9AGAR|nr:hypothetical protein MSAN_00540600 [Mycena sanguinolenta]
MSSDTVFNFHGLARALVDHEFESLRCHWKTSLDRVGSFPFFNLPVEIAVAILKLAATKSSTYSTLMATSRAIADMARLECVPEVVIISTRAAAISFYGCISVYPGVGAGVKQLWLFPDLAAKQAATVFPMILNACYNVERLACRPDHLIEIANSFTFRHTSLVDVTMVDPIIPWDRLFAARHGAALFNQIQMLRLIGGTQHGTTPPLSRTFRNLTDLTISAVTTACVRNYLLDSVRFPSLKRAVVTVPYTGWRLVGMSFLMSEPEMLRDNRLCVVHCSKKWKELDVWKEGKFNLWNSGVTEWNARATGDTGSLLREYK